MRITGAAGPVRPRSRPPPSVWSRAAGAAAFVAGVAAAWLWTYVGRPQGLALILWAGVALVASLGAARVTTQVGSPSDPRAPSGRLCGAASALGVVAVLILEERWLRLLGGGGFLLMLYLALALLAGGMDVALRVRVRSLVAQ